MKICKKCKKEKDIKEFSKDKSMIDNINKWCKECTKEYMIEYRKNNKEKIREYYIKNKSSIDEYQKYYQTNRRHTDLLYRLTKNIMTSISRSFKGFKKPDMTTQDILGCSFKEFYDHIEKNMKNWMNSNNYGKYNGQNDFGWDIDHILAISKGETISDIIKLNHFTNFRPLCSHINRDIKQDN